MRQIGDFIGGIVALFFLGAIIFGVLSSGNKTAIIVVLIIAILILIAVSRENQQVKEGEEKAKAEAKALEEEYKRIQKIENMSESEFIAFVKYNHDELSKHFKNGGVSGLGHGMESMTWSSSRYIIESQIDTNNFNKFITIYKKVDGGKIFSGSWGYVDD